MNKYIHTIFILIFSCSLLWAYDFHLQPDSPCIDAGGFLTHTVDSGFGNTIKVDDAKYFYDGYGIAGEQGDLIQVGSNDPVRITDVDYDTNTITVDQNISWNVGDGVSYPYSGSAPDMGAYEYRGEEPPPTSCEATGGECKFEECSTYENCFPSDGICEIGYCCTGACTEQQPSDCSWVGGICKPEPCYVYNDCTALEGICDSGYCCQGSCTIPEPPPPPPTEPDIFVSPEMVDFGDVDIGEQSVKTVTVCNNGTADLSIGDISIIGRNSQHFYISDDDCSGSFLMPSAECILGIVFSPSSRGVKGALLYIYSNDLDDNPATVELFGRCKKERRR